MRDNAVLYVKKNCIATVYGNVPGSVVFLYVLRSVVPQSLTLVSVNSMFNLCFKELRCFLKTYRRTPHTTTQVAPSKLFFLHARTSGIPEIEELDFDKIEKLHNLARANDRKAIEKMKQEYDERMRVREPKIEVGVRVLVKTKQKKKSDPTQEYINF
ncbi:hypothetical protein BpHYR1_038633 [Brachionus plicatilis]|uniref:Uncharacterized protein n=1 Tax=Brachionus plicatilis TaxID=10195 RepID=A0A3M7PT18_BRAPC|nr:hypothetical protein BpHYR1_038633 [Brachionus plicatilis]